MMHEPRERSLLRIFINENDHFDHKALHEAIVLKAREMQMAGATVLRGPLGYGKSAVLHTSKILRLSTSLPLVIEIVDKDEKIDAFLPELGKMISSGLVTREKVQVLHYGGTNPE